MYLTLVTASRSHRQEEAQVQSGSLSIYERHLNQDNNNGGPLQKTFPIPFFSYHMTIVDQDVVMDRFESHLVTITTAHLETALQGALSTSQTLRRVRVDDFVLDTRDVHRAFRGENSETGQPEALVRCSFTGSMDLSFHGLILPETEEEMGVDTNLQQQREINSIIHKALSNKQLLSHRFSVDSILSVIQDFKVHVSDVNEPKEAVLTLEASSSRGTTDASISPVTGTTLLFTGAFVLGFLLARRMFHRRSASFPSCKRLDDAKHGLDGESHLHDTSSSSGRPGNTDVLDDDASQGSASLPVYV